MKTFTFKSILLLVSACFSVGIVVAATPTTSAPAPPTRSAANVISIFSDAYTNVSGTDLFPNWGQTTAYSAITVGGADNVIKYSNLNYQGIQFGSTQNVSGMTYLHLDVWSDDANAATFPIGLIWTGGEKTVTKTISTSGAWTQLDIPLTEFTGAVLSSAIQFKFQSNEWLTLGAAGSASKYTTVYLDNIYFYTAESSLSLSVADLSVDAAAASTNTFNITSALSWTATSDQSWLTLSSASGTGNTTITVTATANTSYAPRTATVSVKNSDNTTKTVTVTQSPTLPAAAPTPTMAAANVNALYSDAYTVLGNKGWDDWYGNSFSTVSLEGNTTLKNTTTCCFGSAFSTTFDATSMTYLHVDVFPVDATSMTYGIVTSAANNKDITLTAGKWNSIDLTLATDLAGATLSAVKQIGFWNLNGTFYFDNILFYSGSYTTGLKQLSADNELKCFVNDSKQLCIACEQEMTEVRIYNVAGKLIISQRVGKKTDEVNLNGLSSGLYVCKATLSDGSQLSSKFIMQ